MRSLRVTLVNPPHQAHPLGDEKEIAPPLGLLRLASTLVTAGHTPRVEDLNLYWHSDPLLRTDFFSRAIERILVDSPDIIGFTSMAVDTHISLLLAQEIKARCPDTVVVLGGPHASQISDEILRRWPFVDLIIRGIGTQKLAQLACSIGRVTRGSRPISIAHELRNDCTDNTDDERWDFRSGYKLIDWNDYFSLTGRNHANIQGGRGCRYKCSFCYSPAHHGSWRTAALDTLLEEISYLWESGVDDIFFVEDNFMNDSGWAKQAASEIGRAFPMLSWSCYGTFPSLKADMLAALGSGGCRAIFSGIDAITPLARRTYQKSFARNLAAVSNVVTEACSNNIVPTFAFLIAPPSHPTGPEFDETVLAASALQSLDLNALRVRLNALTFYPGSALPMKNDYWSADNSRVELLLDVCPEVAANPFALEAPHLFPFHNRYTPIKEWKQFISRSYILYTLIDSRPQSVMDISVAGAWQPSRIADYLIAELPPLSEVPKDTRRSTVITAFDETFHLVTT